MTTTTILNISSTVHSTLDFEREGKQVCDLYVPHATDRDAWGFIPVPVAVLRNEEGPTALLVGGVHGDEHEGPIVLGEWIRSLDPRCIRGRVIILPALNLPAVRNGRRTSPIDGQDLARVFPGDPAGTPTRRIAHFVARELIPRSDYVLDLHAGGVSLEIMTTAMMRLQEDSGLNERTEAAMRSFGAPMALVVEGGSGNSLVAAAASQGKSSFAVELGSGGRVSPRALSVARAGIAGLLAHAGILPGESAPYAGPLMRAAGPGDNVLAPVEGVFEPAVDLGSEVAAGQQAGRIHLPDQPSREPVVVCFPSAGMVFARRALGTVARGNCLVVVATSVGC